MPQVHDLIVIFSRCGKSYPDKFLSPPGVNCYC
jgi:hypothetical protein